MKEDKEIEEFVNSYKARVVAMDDTPNMICGSLGKFKMLPIEEYDELQSKIADLEAKLAESKNQIRGFQKAIEKRDKQIESLNKGLSKTQKQSYKIKQSKSQDIITIANQTEKERDLLQQIEKIKEQSICFQAQIYDLKQQLAEKENTITNLIEDTNASKEFYKKQFNEQVWLCEELREKLAEKDQDKISFAVDVLEEIADCSNYINSKLDFECGSYVSEKAIRDKIKYLKGNEDE